VSTVNKYEYTYNGRCNGAAPEASERHWDITAQLVIQCHLMSEQLD